MNKIGTAVSKLTEDVGIAALVTEINETAPRFGSEFGGRPLSPTDLMVRILVVQQRYKFSDELMEFQFMGRLSFRRLVGLRQSSQARDCVTILGYREHLIETGTAEFLFEATSRHIDRHGYIE